MTKIKINVNESVTSRLPFKPVEKYDYMCVGVLTNVEVTESEIDGDKSWEYAGKTVPRLAFTFEQLKDDVNDVDRFHTHSEMLVANTLAIGTDRTEKNIIDSYLEQWKHIKHLHDAFKDHSNYAPIKSAPDFDPSLSIDNRITMFKTFYNNIVDAFNKGKDGENSIFDDKYNVTIKLVASGQRESFLAIPSYTGKGFIEKTRIGKSGFKTDLAFYGSETYQLGGAGQATILPGGDPAGAIGGVMSPEARAALGITK